MAVAAVATVAAGNLQAMQIPKLTLDLVNQTFMRQPHRIVLKRKP